MTLAEFLLLTQLCHSSANFRQCAADAGYEGPGIVAVEREFARATRVFRRNRRARPDVVCATEWNYYVYPDGRGAWECERAEGPVTTDI